MDAQTTPAHLPRDGSMSKTVRPSLWLKVSIRNGMLAQLTGTVTGALLLAISLGLGTTATALREACLLTALTLIYLNTHALGHYIVGRAVGIRFAAFGLRGTDHPENYPFGLRHIMVILPMWTAITIPASRRAARPIARAAMYAAGETFTIFFSLAASIAAFLLHAPWGEGILIAMIAWSLGSAFTVSRIEKGDYYKAIRTLRERHDHSPCTLESRRALP